MELTPEQKIKITKLKISTLYKEIQAIRTDAKAAENDVNEFPKFRGKYKQLESLFQEFETKWDALMEIHISLDKEKEFPFEEKYRTQTKTCLYECHAVHETIMNPVPPPRPPRESLNTAQILETYGTQDISSASHARSRLPTIQIPHFNGDDLQWPQFRDVFISLVHDEAAVPLIEKFHYLTGSLSGEALQIATALPITATNYTKAWDALNKRFDNKRLLAKAYLERVELFKTTARGLSGRTHLRDFLKTVGECFAALDSLQIPNEADFFKLYLALECLDPETRELYEDRERDQEFPTFESLIQFAQQRCQTLELSTPVSAIGRTKSKAFEVPNRSKALAAVSSEPLTTNPEGSESPNPIRYSCPKCKGNHLLYRCFVFNSMPSFQRLEYAKRANLCLNCLRTGHVALQCPSKYYCIFCKQKHHTILHTKSSKGMASTSKKRKPKTSSQPSTAANNTPSTSANTLQSTAPSTGLIGAIADSQTVLLGTALVHMRDWRGNPHIVRIVIDSGSQFSIVTTDCAKRLGLRWSPVKRNILGVGCTQPPPAKGTVLCKINPIQEEDRELSTYALAMPAITSNLPSTSLNPMMTEYVNQANLADAKFWESRPVDFLLGADLFLQILSSEPVVKITDNFGMLPTIFGYVVIGTPPGIAKEDTATCLTVAEPPISEELLQRFWQIEEALPDDYPHPEDVACETHFRTNVTRLPSGRYEVALPFRGPRPQFPSSKHLSMKRFRNLEVKLDKDEILKEKYNEFIQEYIQLDHMERTSTDSAFVIPHHAVLKGDLSDIDQLKLRVVFDGSMRTTSGSLNDHLLVGPKLQQDITSVILNFRTHRFAFSTDIIKMFRQILIKSEDRCYQHILWRFSQEEPVQTYQLNTITYGLTSSPYLALRVIRQLIEDEGDKFPNAAKVLKNDIYVDDVITGSDSLEEALTLKKEIISLLKAGCFEVHKWASNSKEFLDTVAGNTKPAEALMPKDNTTKILGMLWDAEPDQFRYQVDFITTVTTKRSILSVIARLYDPLGYLAPIIFYAKSILQDMWLLKLDWDDQPPEGIIHTWNVFRNELFLVKEIRLPRWINLTGDTPTLIGFCDASQKGFAAVLYLRVRTTDSTIQTFIIKAKTRLAPVKTISIPRLELCAAHLLTKLLRSIEDFCTIHSIKETFLFTDSTIVLSWLRMSPSALKTFVANRVGYILSFTQVQHWHHVPSNENPADTASRGVLTRDLLHHELWWSGPSWLREQPIKLPPTPTVLSNVPELKQESVVAMSTISSESLHNLVVERYSSYQTVVAVVAYIFRFINNIRPSSQKTLGALSVDEREQANVYLIRMTQRQYFSADFDFQSEVCISAKFKSLAIFLDATGLLRVGGRLTHAQLPYEHRHPIVLLPEARYTVLLVDYIHRQNFHLGVAALQAYIQRKFYIFRARNLVRRQIWKCDRCFKARAKPNNPFMADLPLSRVSQGRPFIRVGVDYAGPFSIKTSNRRNSPISKGYLAVFVCMSVKAVHLELVSALTTDAFLAAFDRFVARRGMPSDVYSDCGLNFVGAARRLKDLFRWFREDSTAQDITNHTAQQNIQWHFNPPHSPHFGGLWEAAVKSAKTHLLKTLGDRPFTFEELATMFIRIEAVMNSRPLCPISAEPQNYDYLTPGHFLIGSALLAPPEQDLTDVNMGRLSRWQLLQGSVQVFWKRWTNEYLHQLQTRQKWTRHTTPINKDDMVLIQDENLPPLKWKIGRVTDVHPGSDGTVRVVTVRTSNGDFKRSAHKLAVLPYCNSMTD